MGVIPVSFLKIGGLIWVVRLLGEFFKSDFNFWTDTGLGVILRELGVVFSAEIGDFGGVWHETWISSW